MKTLNIKTFFTLINLVIINSLIVQSFQDFNKNQKRILNESEKQFIYLKDAFKDKLKIGSMLRAIELEKAEDFIKNHFDILTPTYELFPEFILNQNKSIEIGDNINPQVEFNTIAKKLFQFCENNNIPINGHTFVWYSMTPNWFFKENFQQNEKLVSKDIMDLRLENFIRNTFDLFEKEFPNLKIYSYVVATEIFINDGGGLRTEIESNWAKIYGDDSFVFSAFAYARKYAPVGCKLLLSDYNEYIPYKTNDIYDIAMRLKEFGDIDGIGMESHLDIGYPSFDDYKIAFEKFTSTGLEIFITELEITTTDLTKQCNYYKDLFLLYLDNKDNISSITLFATNDGWNNIRQSNSLLFDYNYRPKQSYYCVLEALENKE